MKEVLQYLSRRRVIFDERPLFVYLRDSKIEPRERLRFAPYVAHFVMSFADLYHFFLIEEPPRDRYQALINTHLGEEGSHWKWFLLDLASMNLDPTLRFTDALRFIWSDSTVKTRRLAYEVCKLSAGLTPLQKLVLVLTIEATGRAGLEAVVPVARQAEAGLGRRLIYFGQHHLDTEHEHTVEDRRVQQNLETEIVPDSERPALYALIDRVFGHFGDFVDETFHLARSGLGFAELNERPAVDTS